MSMFYDPQLVRALTCERIREARGSCVDGRTLDRPERGEGPVAGLRRLLGGRFPSRLLGGRTSIDSCTC
jgi:hypothetical protein